MPGRTKTLLDRRTRNAKRKRLNKAAEAPVMGETYYFYAAPAYWCVCVCVCVSCESLLVLLTTMATATQRGKGRNRHTYTDRDCVCVRTAFSRGKRPSNVKVCIEGNAEGTTENIVYTELL